MESKVGKRVLVVDDDVGVQRVLTRLLELDGFVVSTVGRGADAAGALRSFDPDLVVLDLGLPDINGFDLLRSLRDMSDVPVIVLSGRADEADRVLALETGADDYVVKPFLNREFVARVRVRLRRPPSSPAGASPGVVRDDDLSIDVSAREVWMGGELLPLTAKEFDLLQYLASAPRQVFSRAQLLDRVWQSSSDWQGEGTVTEHIHRLRQKVGDRRITTVRGVGYRYDPVESSVS